MANRQVVRDAVGEQSEELILLYTKKAWRGTAVIPRIFQEFGACSQPHKDVLLVRLANELEEYLDLGILYCEDVERRVQFSEIYGRYMINLADLLGASLLSAWLTQAFEAVQGETLASYAGNQAPLLLRHTRNQAELVTNSSGKEALYARGNLKGNADQREAGTSLDQSVAAVFTQQALLHPEQVAIERNAGTLSYGALHEQSDLLAHAIVARFGPGNDPIVTLAGHNENVAILALGVWKAGKIWVPLDATHPAQRLLQITEDSKAVCILSEEGLQDLARSISTPDQTICRLSDLTREGSTRETLPELSAEALACVLYTSGSTGKPKGVVHNHRNLVHLAWRGAQALKISASDRLTMLPSCSQIAGITDLLRALLNGATLLPFDVRGNSVKNLAHWLMRQKASIYHSSPTLFRMLADSLQTNEKVPNVHVVHLGGEAVTQEDVALFKQHFVPDCVLMNHLGCTELSGYCQLFIGHDFVLNKSAIPAGYAVKGVKVSVCDEQGEEVPVGEIGEIRVSSPYLALGYWHRPEETQMSFSKSASDGECRTYRTGDWGYMKEDGCLVYAGRADGQVQIRGNRVDSAEIEAVLTAHPLVQRVGVKISQNHSEPLIVFVKLREKGVLSESELRKFVKTKLPTFMIPSVEIVEHLPLTANGKINYRQLGTAEELAKHSSEGCTLPRTQTERNLARLWGEFVNAETIAVEDDFFVLGGDSLLVTRLVNRIESEYGIDASLHDIFQHPTLGELATIVAARRINKVSDRLSDFKQHKLLLMLAEIEALSEAQSQQMLKDTLKPAISEKSRELIEPA
ncbi:MAG: AMP-binding protein [Gammaproteobacteria bacterium]